MISVVLFLVWISNIIYSGDRNFWNKNSIDNQEKKWKQNQLLERIDYIKKYHLISDTPDEIIDLCRDYESNFEQIKSVTSDLFKKEDSYPFTISKLESEISHYGDTIDKNDIEYISRKNEIKNMKKELKSIELELKNLRQKQSQLLFKINRYSENIKEE
ncbi:hypothetical protein EB821_04035 [Candidatus Marinimicrobia bacterium PRS2]|nr:hypothetical protein EB821_04035 [Candidatus Marinimicrobia bacterium PRS2]